MNDQCVVLPPRSSAGRASERQCFPTAEKPALLCVSLEQTNEDESDDILWHPSTAHRDDAVAKERQSSNRRRMVLTFRTVFFFHSAIFASRSSPLASVAEVKTKTANPDFKNDWSRHSHE